MAQSVREDTATIEPIEAIEETELKEETEEDQTEEEVNHQEDPIVGTRRRNFPRMLLRPRSNSTTN